MRLYAKCLPEYFRMIMSEFKSIEFRQIECILLENQETHETIEFKVQDIHKIDPQHEPFVKKTFPGVPWDEKLPIFAIELGEEIGRTEVPVIEPHVIEQPEKTWCGVGE